MPRGEHQRHHRTHRIAHQRDATGDALRIEHLPDDVDVPVQQRPSPRLGAVAEAGQVDHDHPMVDGEGRDDPVPVLALSAKPCSNTIASSPSPVTA
jgi:hypothetical protein